MAFASGGRFVKLVGLVVGGSACVAAVVGASMLGLAHLAVREPTNDRRPSPTGATSAAGMRDPLAAISGYTRSATDVAGHNANLSAARLLADGRSLAKIDADGGVRLTDIVATARLPDRADGGVLSRLGSRLWSTYGLPAAQWSLDAVARVSVTVQRPLTHRDCDVCPEMVVVPAGSFIMGSPESEQGRESDEGPLRRVTIARPFAVALHEVTRDAFAAFVAATGYGTQEAATCFAESKIGEADWGERERHDWRFPGYPQNGRHPVVCVSWEGAKAYAAWLSARTGYTYRLPTEAEWEYAARGGTSTRYSFGDQERDLCQFANGADASAKSVYGNQNWTFAECDDRWVHTASVGSLKPNAFGLHDMHGNALEWVEDCYDDNYRDAPTDGSARPANGGCVSRVLRSGSWDGNPRDLRAARRRLSQPDGRSNLLGFRLARTLASSASAGWSGQ